MLKSQKAEKTINYKLWKNSLKSDGQQYHSYQQNQYSYVTLTHWTQKYHISLEIQVLSWDKHTPMAGLNLLMGSQPSSHLY